MFLNLKCLIKSFLTLGECTEQGSYNRPQHVLRGPAFQGELGGLRPG